MHAHKCNNASHLSTSVWTNPFNGTYRYKQTSLSQSHDEHVYIQEDSLKLSCSRKKIWNIFCCCQHPEFFFLSQCNFSWHFQLCNRAANNFMRLQNCMFYEADKSLAVLANVCMYVQVNALKMMCCNILKVGQICSVFSVIITVMYYVAWNMHFSKTERTSQ